MSKLNPQAAHTVFVWVVVICVSLAIASCTGVSIYKEWHNALSEGRPK